MLNKKAIDRLIRESQKHHCPKKGICVKIQAIAKLPTRYGDFQIVSFYNNYDHKDHVAIIKGNLPAKNKVLTRLHSECLTGDALGSVRCDCRDQLTAAMQILGKQKTGALLYLRQEGRGIGLVNKIKAYALQDQGFDTVEADKILGFSGDEREYGVAAHMLNALKIKSIRLMTNNPKKIAGLSKYGIKITARVPLIVPANSKNRSYLETKKNKAGHLFSSKDLNKSFKNLEQAEETAIKNSR